MPDFFLIRIAQEGIVDKSIFRKNSMDRIASPEHLDDYLYVTSPALWVILLAIILLLAGFLFWGSVTKVESFAAGRICRPCRYYRVL